jgi:hypothetical protein
MIQKYCNITNSCVDIVELFVANKSIKSFIVNFIKTAAIKKNQTMMQMCKVYGINTEVSEKIALNDQGECSWIPSVFCSKEKSNKAYGGVNLSVNLKAEQNLDKEISDAIRSRAGFGTIQTGKYTFEKHDIFTGDITKYNVSTSSNVGGWRKHISYITETTEKSFKPISYGLFSNNNLSPYNSSIFPPPINNNSPNCNSFLPLINNYNSFEQPTNNSTNNVNIKVIRRNFENVPFRIGHFAHSGLLIEENGKHHLLEVMADGKAHLIKDVNLESDKFKTFADYNINGKDWRGQSQGLNVSSKYNSEKLQEMMQKIFDDKGNYNLNIFSDNYNTCHTAQEELIKILKKMMSEDEE